MNVEFLEKFRVNLDFSPLSNGRFKRGQRSFQVDTAQAPLHTPDQKRGIDFFAIRPIAANDSLGIEVETNTYSPLASLGGLSCSSFLHHAISAGLTLATWPWVSFSITSVSGLAFILWDCS